MSNYMSNKKGKQRNCTWKAVVTASLLTLMVCGCGSTASNEKASYAAMEEVSMESAAEYDGLYDAYETPAEAPAAPEEGKQEEQIDDHGRKLIRTYTINAETKDFEKLIQDVESQVTALGGYIENSDLGENSYRYGGRYANYVIRIPKDKAPGFVAHVEEASNVTQKTENVEDVTLAYVDLESHKKALVTEQDRLLALLEQAETVEDIITIEGRLSDVRYELESMESQLRTYDNKIDYSTIRLNITEVEEITLPAKKTFLGRLSEGLAENFKSVGEALVDVAVWLITGIPYWILLAVLVLLVLFIVKICKKASLKKRQQAWEAQQRQLAAAAAAATAQTGAPVQTDAETKQETGSQPEGKEE